ncbi:MAG: hypothetical protein BGP06_04770 [Rhizobiales bacterium 65-9]|nr:CoA transferase [Hyphomicrobiales bacterium]OJY38889.1 MAG: hypothetical protein BGP06_04770 [Rhizobiales bacterium 65-9]
MATPLQGVKVVELTTMITGSMAGMMLGDLGADIVKVEQPDGGDPFRAFNGGVYSPYFCSYNRNKRSIVLDLRSALGKEAVAALIASCDVLLDNFRPGVLDRLGLSDSEIRTLNPNLIHCSITGFGPDGPYVGKPAYDSVAQALGGLASMLIPAENPEVFGPTIADNVTAHCACQGVLAALMGRLRGQPGRRVEVNMLDATISFIPDAFGLMNQLGIFTDSRSRARSSQSYAFACADGKLLAVHLSSRDKFWDAFVEATGRGDLNSDPRFAGRQARVDNYDDLRRALAPTFLERTRADWVKRFADFDVPAAPIYDVSEVENDEQVRHLGAFFDMTHPTEGAVRSIRRPIWFDGSRQDQPVIAPPTLGEHTQAVLAELGLADKATRV